MSSLLVACLFLACVLAVGESRPQTLECKVPEIDGGKCNVRTKTIGRRNIDRLECNCDRDLTMNINPETMFSCKWDRKLARRTWRPDKIVGKTYRRFHPENITCLEICDAPVPEIPTAMLAQTHPKITKWLRDGPRPNFVGETLTFSCQSGYTLEEPNKDIEYDYLDSSNLTESLMCMANRKWDVSLTDVILGTCRAITCEALQFANMSNGHVINYKENYGFHEEMKLECDAGYRPIDLEEIRCTKTNSFEKKNFGCEEILCPVLKKPLQGHVDDTRRSIGDNVTFSCDVGTLFGKETWTCQENGQWDSDCVICVSDDDHCPPPCMTPNLHMTTYPFDFSVGSKLEFNCGGSKGSANAVERECRQNGMWTGYDIDCIGIKDFDARRTWRSLAKAMGSIETLANITVVSETEDDYNDIIGKTIDPNAEGGTDVYFLLDMSNSITEEMFDKKRKFVKALLPLIGISRSPDGTRIAIFPFASRLYRYYDGTTTTNAFANYTEAQNKFNKLNRTELLKEIDTGTAIADAFSEVYDTVSTKYVDQNGDHRRPHYVRVVLISDGIHTTSGDPMGVVDRLKNFKNADVQIYSIFIGKAEMKVGRQKMKAIASNIVDETHFFAINTDNDDLSKVIQGIVGEEPEPLQCGQTDVSRIGFNGNETKDRQDAKEGAWPWIVQVIRNKKHICGGSLIDESWVLTAAHCFDEGDDKISLKFGSIKLNDENAEAHSVKTDNIIKHEGYKKSTTRYAHDIALIKLTNPIEMSDLVPICYKPDGNSEDVLLGPGRFGQTMGWGTGKNEKEETLQQMQMEIQKDDKCPTNSPSADVVWFNNTYMFCAGGKDDESNTAVDTVQGDSGGPFMAQYVTEPGRFRQIGIVSFGIKKKDLKDNDENFGFYTKLPAYIEWIDDQIERD